MDLSDDRPGSSWPDKLHSQRPFPSLGKKVCILFSPTTVTNAGCGVVSLSSLWTALKPKTTARDVYILYPCFPYFYPRNWGHTWESAWQQRKRQDSGLRFEAIYNQRWCFRSIIRNRNISENYWVFISWFHTCTILSMVWPQLLLQFRLQHNEFSKLNYVTFTIMYNSW